MKLCALVLLAAAMLCTTAAAQYRDDRGVGGSNPATRRGSVPKFERDPIYPTPILIEGRLGLGYVKDPVADAIADVNRRMDPTRRRGPRSGADSRAAA